MSTVEANPSVLILKEIRDGLSWRHFECLWLGWKHRFRSAQIPCFNIETVRREIFN